LIKNDFLIIR